MKFVKFRDFTGIRIQPLNNKKKSVDMVLFRHITGGLDSINTRTFNMYIIELLYIHGINIIEIIDRSRKKNKK